MKNPATASAWRLQNHSWLWYSQRLVPKIPVIRADVARASALSRMILVNSIYTLYPGVSVPTREWVLSQYKLGKTKFST